MPLISDNPKENPKSGIQQYMTNDIRDAIRFMNSDPGIVLMKSRTSTFPIFWSNLGKAGLLKKGWDTKTNNMEYNYQELQSWFYLKDIIGEGTWLILCGIVTILISYNYIHGQTPPSSLSNIKETSTDDLNKLSNEQLQYRSNR